MTPAMELAAAAHALCPTLGSPAYLDGQVLVYECGHDALANGLRAAGLPIGAVVTDPPYSARTHEGHNGVTEAVNGALPPDRAVAVRRGLAYDSMTPDGAAAMASLWASLDPAWMFLMTDDELVRPLRVAMEASGRRAFQSIPCVIDGMTVRLTGDGPSSEAVHGVCSRRRSAEMVRWGTLRGYYRGPSERCPWVGGKPLWLVRAIVRDYSRPDDLIVDPFCGGGTLGPAVRYEGRRAILSDKDPAAIECTIKRLRGERTKPTRDDFPETQEQPSLFTKPGGT